MEVLKKLGNLIIDILIAIIAVCFAFALYHYISIKILHNPYTNFFGYTYFNIKTGSMEDTINIDDYVFVKVSNDIKENDIVSYVQDGKVVTHRIIRFEDDGTVITKGDANNTEDDPIEKEQIIGPVVKVGKQYGVVLKVITEPTVIVPFFGGIILIDIALTNHKKKKKTYKDILDEMKKEQDIKDKEN